MSADPFECGFESAFAERIDRRKLLRRAAGAGAGLALAPWVATTRAFASSRTIKIGYVTPRTGPLAAFGQADAFVIKQMGHLFNKGLRSGANTYPVQIIGADAQSNSNRAATVAQDLILKSNVDLHLETGAPVDPAQGQAVVFTPEGVDAVRLAAESWAQAAIVDGDEPATAKSAAENTIAFYTTAPES